MVPASASDPPLPRSGPEGLRVRRSDRVSSQPSRVKSFGDAFGDRAPPCCQHHVVGCVGDTPAVVRQARGALELRSGDHAVVRHVDHQDERPSGDWGEEDPGRGWPAPPVDSLGELGGVASDRHRATHRAMRRGCTEPEETTAGGPSLFDHLEHPFQCAPVNQLRPDSSTTNRAGGRRCQSIGVARW